MSTLLYKYDKPFELESGAVLPELELGYHTFGTLNTSKDNVVWVCHAFTANSDVLDWWKGLFGTGYYFNPEQHFIVCVNMLGSAYGSSGPLSINPTTGQPYYLTFPLVTTRDMVTAQQLLAAYLGITNIHILIGGSLGGQQAAEWAIMEPDFIMNLILIASNAKHSPWGIAFNESQRLAIAADPTFEAGSPTGGARGLKAARAMALLSYRGYKTYGISQHEDNDEVIDNYKASSYQNYQGDKLVKRFNAYSYWYLTKSMDSHNVGRNRASIEKALGAIKARTLVIAIDSDLLFPVEEQKYLAKNIPGAVYAEFDSYYGHDGFLIETEALTNIISSFFKKEVNGQTIQIHQTA
jgi:homoserine O-acetyltransferase